MTTTAALLTVPPPPQPLLRWVGGKRRLLPTLSAALPREYQRHIEPFVGGGSFFLSLPTPGARCIIGDAFPALAHLYLAARDEPDELLTAVKGYSRKRSKASFTKYRALPPTDSVDLAAWLLYIARTSYNGLIRHNKNGVCNSSWGGKSSTPILNSANLERVHQRLQGCTIVSGDWTETCALAMPGDFVYLDPPYIPLNATSSFRSYTASGFSLDDHKQLAEAIHELTRRGVYVMLSNSAARETRSIYRGLEMHSVQVRRSIGAKASSRGEVKEILAVNYLVDAMAHPEYVRAVTRRLR